MFDHVVFLVAGNCYAFPSGVFQMFLGPKCLEPPPPGASPTVVGTFRFGDERIPVIDLRRLFGETVSDASSGALTIVSRRDGFVGFMVDRLLHADMAALDVDSPTFKRLRLAAAPYFAGIVAWNVEGREVVVSRLNLELIIASALYSN
jgi:chemotaxis signal transduction protein